MKIGFTVLIAFFLSGILSAQDYFEQVFTNEDHTSVREILTTDELSFVAGHIHDCDAPYIACFDASGTQVWEDSPIGEYGFVTNISLGKDSSIYGTIRWSVGDHTGNQQEDGIYFFKYSFSGELLVFEKAYVAASPSSKNTVLELPDTTYLLGIQDTLIKLDRNGAIITSYSFSSSEINDLQLYNDTSVVVSYRDLEFDRVLSHINLQGTILQNLFISTDIFRPVTIGQIGADIVVHHDNTIKQWNPITNTNQLVNNPAIPNITGIDVFEEQLYCYGMNTTQDFFDIARQDMNGVWEIIYSYPLTRRTFPKVEIRNEILYLGGDMYLENEIVSPGGRLYSLGLFQQIPDFIQPEQPEFDIGVTFVRSPQFELSTTDYWDLDGDTTWQYMGQGNVMVEVTNFGNTVVDEFIVASELIWAFNCVEERAYQQVTNANLMPGDSMWISTSFYKLVIVEQDEEVEISACFFTGAPNQKIDSNFGNNRLCKFLISDVNEPLPDLELKVYPNPVSAEVNIELSADNGLENIQLYDLTGRLIYTEKLDGQQKYQIQNTNWPSGLYWLKVETKEGWVSKKVVIE